MIGAVAVLLAVIQPLWPADRMPDAQPHQIAAPSQERDRQGFDREAHRVPYLDWSERPVKPNGACVMIIPGGGYICTCDGPRFKPIERMLLTNGYACVWLWYRTPRPKGTHRIYRSAWQDGQRAVRLVRQAAKERGFDPERIGVTGCSAGSHLAVLLATSALTPAYRPIDEVDALPCHVNWAMPFCPAFVLTDGLKTPNLKGGEGPDVRIDDCFKFDAKTAPMCLFHGLKDEYSPNASRRLAERLTQMGIPVETHFDPDRGHGMYEVERRFALALEFMKRQGYDR